MVSTTIITLIATKGSPSERQLSYEIYLPLDNQLSDIDFVWLLFLFGCERETYVFCK